MKKFNHVIVRRPCKAMVEGITSGLYPGKPDFELALKEHDAYIEALKQCDVEDVYKRQAGVTACINDNYITFFRQIKRIMKHQIITGRDFDRQRGTDDARSSNGLSLIHICPIQGAADILPVRL